MYMCLYICVIYMSHIYVYIYIYMSIYIYYIYIYYIYIYIYVYVYVYVYIYYIYKSIYISFLHFNLLIYTKINIGRIIIKK